MMNTAWSPAGKCNAIVLLCPKKEKKDDNRTCASPTGSVVCMKGSDNLRPQNCSLNFKVPADGETLYVYVNMRSC